MRSTVSATVAIGLARVVVPLWLLVGAILKLVDGSPRHLPLALVEWLGPLGIDLGFVLRFSIVVELTVVGVMWLLPRLARPVGIAMLAAFLPVLIGDVAMGASSCGCFGAVQVPPVVTMVMDVGFLLGLWLLGRGVESLTPAPVLATRNVVAAGLWGLASCAVAFGLTTGGAPAVGAAPEPATAAAACRPRATTCPTTAAGSAVGGPSCRSRVGCSERPPTSPPASGCCFSTARTASTATS
jgi:hypothetical protein